MEVYSFILAVHIVGAIASFVYAGYAFASLARTATQNFSGHAYILALGIGFQTITGGILALLSPEVTALSLCDSLIMYITPLALIEYLLVSRMMQNDILVPAARLAYPTLGSLAAFGLLVVVGV